MQANKREYGSDYLYAEDFLVGGSYRSINVEISEVFPPGSLKAANGKQIEKWVIAFKGKSKKLCLAKTNTSIIHLVTGDPPGESWVGRAVTLQARVVKAFGADTLAIRVIPPVGTVLRRTLIERLGRAAVFKPLENESE